MPGFMEFIRAVLAESTVNVYTEAEIATPVGRSVRQAMLIWLVEWSLDDAEAVDTAISQSRAHLAKDSQSAVLGLQDSSLISRKVNTIVAGSAQGSLTEYMQVGGTQHPDFQRFDPPLLYANSSLFLGIGGVGNLSARSVAVRVGYTIEQVTSEEFLEALVE